ncbi:MAG: putative Ig domain-containing protein [Actinomycetales bacterium]|nr:putative Ig domain-containing protein [Actinomycetales bacterium]
MSIRSYAMSSWSRPPHPEDPQLQGGGIPLTSIAPGLSIGVPYGSLGYGGGYTATISARKADGQVVATCDMSVQVPWVAPGKPLIDSLIPGAGGLVTVNYSVADPATVLGIESSVDGGPWVRPGGSAPVGGSGGAFTISGLSAGRHLVTLRSVGLDPGPLTTQGQAQAVVIPATSTSGSSAGPASAVPARPVTTVPGTSNGAGSGTNGALASGTGDAAIDAPCLAPDGTLYPALYATVGSQLTMAPNTHGMGTPTSFVIVGGALAPGLMLDRAFGIVYGVPTQAGSWATTVRATFVDGSTRSGQFTTRVDADEQTLQYAARNVGSIGSALSIAPTTSAPAVGTAYRLVCGILPAGTRLDQRSGWITGTPTEVVSMPTPLRIAQTTASGSAAASFILVVNPAGRVSVSYPAHPHVRVGKRIWLRPTVTGAGQITEFRMWKGKLPRGLHLNRATGAVTGRIAHAGPTHTITIVATTKAGALLTAPAMRLRLQG